MDDDTSDPQGSAHSDITSSTKHSSPCTSNQAGCHKPKFESLLYKLLQRLLEFKSKDPVPIVLSALEDDGTCSVVDFLGLSEEDIESSGFEDNRGFKRLGSSHKQSIRILQVLIDDNIDLDGETQHDILKTLTTKCIKGHRVRLIEEQRKNPPPESPSSKPNDHGNHTVSTDPSETLLATELKRWKAAKQDHSKHPIIRDDCDCFTWRGRFIPLLRNQHPTPLLQPGHTVPIDPSKRSTHKEKVNCLWTILVHVFQSPRGQAALSQFEPKDCTIQETMPAIACAALPSTFRETTLRPATSTTEYIMVMSLQST